MPFIFSGWPDFLFVLDIHSTERKYLEIGLCEIFRGFTKTTNQKVY